MPRSVISRSLSLLLSRMQRRLLLLRMQRRGRVREGRRGRRRRRRQRWRRQREQGGEHGGIVVLQGRGGRGEERGRRDDDGRRRRRRRGEKQRKGPGEEDAATRATGGVQRGRGPAPPRAVRAVLRTERAGQDRQHRHWCGVCSRREGVDDRRGGRIIGASTKTSPTSAPPCP